MYLNLGFGIDVCVFVWFVLIVCLMCVFVVLVWSGYVGGCVWLGWIWITLGWVVDFLLDGY